MRSFSQQMGGESFNRRYAPRYVMRIMRNCAAAAVLKLAFLLMTDRDKSERVKIKAKLG